MQQLLSQAQKHTHNVARGPVPSVSGRGMIARPKHGLVNCARGARTQFHVHCVDPDKETLGLYPAHGAFLAAGVPTEVLHRALRLEPSVLNYNVERTDAVLQLLLDIGLTGEDIGKVLIAFPQAFQLSLDHHAQPVIEFLRTDLALGPTDVRDLITRFPAILGMNVKGQLRPQLAYLSSLGVSRDSLPTLILSRPLVLGPGIETVTAFLRRCGVPRSQMARLLRSCPLDYRVHLKGGSAAASGSGPNFP